MARGNVTDIRNLHATGNHTYKAIAKKYGMSGRMIADLITGKYWKHVPFPARDHFERFKP